MSLPDPFFSPDDSDYDEFPEERLGVPASVMTKKVGMVQMVWIVDQRKGSGLTQMPFKLWESPDREYRVLFRRVPLPFAGVEGQCSPWML